MKLETADIALLLVSNSVRWTNSFFNVAKNDSETALSKHDPTRPIDGRILAFFKHARNWPEVYCEP